MPMILCEVCSIPCDFKPRTIPVTNPGRTPRIQARS
jgi:hypothetical protein